MNILVINAGSSSLKYQLFSIESNALLAKGLAERINIHGGKIKHQYLKDGVMQDKIVEQELPNHSVAFKIISDLLSDAQIGVIANPTEITAVGHRIVHGGEKFIDTQVITQEVKEKIKELMPLAPLHNPPNFVGVEAAENNFPNAIQVAVFDTSFHHTLPEHVYRYAIPENLYHQHGIRAYGFHGTSHKYVYNEAKKYSNNPKLKAITIHLGNGCSMAAIDENGHSVDTSMGFGTLNGLIMGTRSGDIDPAAIFQMMEQMGLSLDEVKDILYKESGMLGLAGSSDARDVQTKYEQGDKNAQLCYEMYGYRVRKYIGAFLAALNGADTLIFTAGLGENDALIRHYACKNLENLGIKLDEDANIKKNHPKEIVAIQTAESKVKILIVPTNEELQIARETYELIQKA